MTISGFDDARRILNDFVPRDWSMSQPYTLDRMKSLMKFLGDPQNQLKIVHVAGTSGKTSTSYYIAALLSQTGAKVGLTVSPHVSEINERLQIDLVPLEEKIYCEELGEFLDLIAKSNEKPTYFELLVAFAYWEFVKQSVDYAVIEVGLGGLLDGTNVINRIDKVCVITDIGLDHVKVLGKTIPEIAKQKAGIIGEGNETFAYKQEGGVKEVLETAAKEHNAHLHLIESTQKALGIEFLPRFQQRNFSLALEAAEYVIRRDNLSTLNPTQLLNAAKTQIPARMEIFHKEGKIIIVDGAHNAQKLHALIDSIEAQFPSQKVAVMASFVAGGEERLDSALSELSRLSKNLILTTFSGEQDTPKHSVDPNEVVEAADKAGMDVTFIEDSTLALAALYGKSEKVLLVTGSFFLLNHIRPLMLRP